jgi:hypothetical protein
MIVPTDRVSKNHSTDLGFIVSFNLHLTASSSKVVRTSIIGLRPANACEDAEIVLCCEHAALSKSHWCVCPHRTSFSSGWIEAA